MNTRPNAKNAFHKAYKDTLNEEKDTFCTHLLGLVFDKKSIPVSESELQLYLSDIAGVTLKRQDEAPSLKLEEDADRLVYIIVSKKSDIDASQKELESFFKHYRDNVIPSSANLSFDEYLQCPRQTMGLIKTINLPFHPMSDDYDALYPLFDKQADNPILIDNDNVMGEDEITINPVVKSGHITYPDMQLVVIQFDGEPHKILRVDAGINIDDEFLLELASQEEGFGKRNLNFVEVAQWKAGVASTHPVSDRMRVFYSTDDQLEHLEEKQAAKSNRKPIIQP